MREDDVVELRGMPGSPYTRKMLAWLRYKRIPYAVHWARQEPDGYPSPKVRLLPTFYIRDSDDNLEAVVDSTPIIKRLDTEFPSRSSLPDSPILAFLSDLIEDYADEWLTKCMFHYRWAFEEDAANAGPLLTYFSNVAIDETLAEQSAAAISERQINRLYVVGSNDVTGEVIEASYLRIIDILNELVQQQRFVLGSRPCAADFGIFGQFTQLAFVEPTSANILQKRSQRLRAWFYQLEDLSGLEPTDDDWAEPEVLKVVLRNLLHEIGATYVPVMLANHEAINAGSNQFETTVLGKTWTQPTFPYQAKCLQWIREAYFRMDVESRHAVLDVIRDSGCEQLIETTATK